MNVILRLIITNTIYINSCKTLEFKRRRNTKVNMIGEEEKKNLNVWNTKSRR